MRTSEDPALGRIIDRLSAERSLPFAVTSHWLKLASAGIAECPRDERGIPTDPLLAQCLPTEAEFVKAQGESKDPLGEKTHEAGSRVLHQYGSRVLVRATGECAMFCRYCFRRSLLPSERGFITEREMDFLEGYLADHKEVREVLVSGGDPLTASDEKLRALFKKIRGGRPDAAIRLCTRMPFVLPERVDDGLAAMLAEFFPLRLALHVNHPAELSREALRALSALRKAGIPLRSQTVLLRGVNDDPDTLARLFSSLSAEGADPYYLFQGDLAEGTAHFRVPLSRGLAIYRELRKRLSGLELPRYAVDAPEGGGKLYLPESVLGRDGGFWLLQGSDGRVHRYPEEP